MGPFTYRAAYIFIAVSETGMFVFSNTATIRIMQNYVGYKSCTPYNVAQSARLTELHGDLLQSTVHNSCLQMVNITH
jgi:hypothetical protein